jgi:hypothetical protein
VACWRERNEERDARHYYPLHPDVKVYKPLDWRPEEWGYEWRLLLEEQEIPSLREAWGMLVKDVAMTVDSIHNGNRPNLLDVRTLLHACDYLHNQLKEAEARAEARKLKFVKLNPA